MHGIVNWFVLSNIFGNDFQFTNALIEYVRSEPLAGDISMEFVIGSKVINPPAKWKQWDKVYVKIDFSFVKKLYYRIENKQFIIQTFTIRTHLFIFCIKKRPKKSVSLGGRRWIRTIEARSNRFTVCPLWPLGNSPRY